MLTIPEQLAVLTGSILCLLLAGVIAGTIVADVLDERDRRRTGHVPRCIAPRGWDCSCPPR